MRRQISFVLSIVALFGGILAFTGAVRSNLPLVVLGFVIMMFVCMLAREDA